MRGWGRRLKDPRTPDLPHNFWLYEAVRFGGLRAAPQLNGQPGARSGAEERLSGLVGSFAQCCV